MYPNSNYIKRDNMDELNKLKKEVDDFYIYLKNLKRWKEESIEGIRRVHGMIVDENEVSGMYKEYLETYSLSDDEKEHGYVIKIIEMIIDRYEHNFNLYEYVT